MLIYMDLLVFYMHYELLKQINIAPGQSFAPWVQGVYLNRRDINKSL